MKHSWLAGLVVAGGVVAALTFGGETVAETNATVIELTQVPCQFLEPEGEDHGYKSKRKADCEKINSESGETRVSSSVVIKLKPGDYVFRVTNKSVPYELGFWLRDHDYDWKNPLHRLSKTSVSGGGLREGKTLEYKVSLRPGKYLYSCPLNTTPDYTVIDE